MTSFPQTMEQMEIFSCEFVGEGLRIMGGRVRGKSVLGLRAQGSGRKIEGEGSRVKN